MVDYSKWNNIDLSDDDSDCHPNIERNTWLRMKKDMKQRKAEEARAQRAKEDQELAANLKSKEELEAKLAQNEDAALRSQVEKVTKKISDQVAKRAKEDELAKKYPKWDDDNICHDGFSKTVVNKATIATDSPPVVKPAAPAAAVPAASSLTPSASASSATTTTATSTASKVPLITEPTRLGRVTFSDRSDERIVDIENKAQHFAKRHSFEDYFQFISEHPDIINQNVQTYLLLHCSDSLKKGQEAASKRYLRASCVVQYCSELGRDGISLFFARMRDPNPKFRTEFDKETIAYWGRIKEKLPELRAASQPKPEDQEEEEQYEILGELPANAVPANVPVAEVD